MCQNIIIVGVEIKTPRELEGHWPKINTALFLSCGYTELKKDACLCQLDVDGILQALGYKYEKGIHYEVIL